MLWRQQKEARRNVRSLAAEMKTYKSVHVEGMKGITIKHCITAAEMKLRMMNENWAFYVAAAADTATGKAELNKKVKSVIDNLPDKFEDLTGDNLDDDGNKGK